MVGLLFQAVANKQMVCFLYRGMKRYVRPVRVSVTPLGTAVLLGWEHGSPAERQYNLMEMIGLTLVQDPNIPEARRSTPWIYAEEAGELTQEEKLRLAASKM